MFDRVFEKKKLWCMALNLKPGAGYLRYCDMTNRQMALHLPEKNIQLVPVSDMQSG